MRLPVAVLKPEELDRMDAYWRAANYLSDGQIYLLDNPLLNHPLTRAHIKPRLLGHWGRPPGLNFIYMHLGRVNNLSEQHIQEKSRFKVAQAVFVWFVLEK